MAKKRKQGRKGPSMLNSGMYQGTTLRQENIGKTHVDVSSVLKMQHLHRLATWAGGEARVSPLGVFFGSRLAANSEAAGIPLDPSSVLCERCESILQPGFNCTIRVEKNTGRQSKKSRISSQNNVVYTCHLCSHCNLKAGTWKGHVKDLLASRTRPHCSTNEAKCNFNKGSVGAPKLDQSVIGKTLAQIETIPKLVSSTPVESAVAQGIPINKSPMTPLLTLENSSKKKRKMTGSMPSKLQMSGSSPATMNSGTCSNESRKRRRKGWSSLKDIVANNEAKSSRSINKFSIPFLLQCDKKDVKEPTYSI